MNAQFEQAERSPVARRTTICFPFTGDTVGGSHISALGLLKGLDRSRYRVIVVPQYPDGAIARLFADHEVEVATDLEWRDFVPGEPFTAAKFTRAITGILPVVRFLRRLKVDIVHSNDGRTHATWGPAARLAGARLIWHHRGDPTALGVRLVAPLIADWVVSVSDFALPKARFWPALKRAEVLHSPFDTDLRIDRSAARATLLQETGLPADSLIVGYFGNLIPRKRPLLFIDAIAKLRALMPTRAVYGLMFGAAESPGMTRSIDDRIAALDAGEWIRMMGWKSPGAMWIAACDQLLVPAISEPFGRTLIEAMVVGTPVIATRSGGNIEALRNGDIGLLVPPEDADALAAACAKLATDPALAAMFSQAAQTDAIARFGEEGHCQRVSAIYDMLVEQRGHQE
ncbi:MAG: glycosyltransferase [Sphingomonadales bacterium]|nr:glycosyltransferase [Sphingomonadales bacterium]